MKAGLIADLVVALIIIINLIICTRHGLVRCVLRSFSTFLALLIAIMTASPLANLFNDKFNWVAKVENWHVPFISPETLLKLLIGVTVFVLMRLFFILLDKLLKYLKEKLKAINVIDRILGTVYGALSVLIELTLIFMLIDQLGWASFLGLTADSGGFFAYRLFDFSAKYLFNILTNIIIIATSATPQIEF